MIGDRDLRDDLAAAEAARRFGEDSSSLDYVQTSESAVYALGPGRHRFLRLTPAYHRTPDQIEAELGFVRYLVGEGYQASAPVMSSTGNWLETVESADQTYHCAVFEAAPGEAVVAFSEDWNESLFNRWGAAIRHLHALSAFFHGSGRWDWFEEPALAAIHPTAEDALAGIRSSLGDFAEAGYGMIHGDFGRPNFHVDGKKLTVFDFDDCCRHYFAYDVAVALWPLRRRPQDERDRYLDWMLAGYEGMNPVTDDFRAMLPLMFRLRSLFMYAYHLRKWGDEVPPDRVAWLEGLRADFG